MPDISKYLKQAEELDKKRGISSNPSVMPTVTPGGTVTQAAGPDISAYLAQAEKLDRERSAAPTTTPNTTRADGAGVGGNGYEIQMPKLEVNALGAGGGAKEGGNLWDRIRDTLSGGIKQSVGGNVDTMGTMYEATQGQRDTLYDQQREWTAHQLARAEADLAAYTADGNAYMAKVTQGEVERLRTQLNAYDTVKQGQVQQKATTAARDMAAQVTQSGAQDIERAKEGLGLVGQALVDAGASGVQMLGDASLGALTGVGGLAPMAFRAFGGGTQKARAEGADLDEQILYGGAQAAKEWVTEKLFSVALPFAKTYGKGSLDDVVEKSIGKAVDRFAKSALGKRALGGGLTLGAAALGEGLEEGLGTFLEWQLPRIYGGDVASFGETLEEAAYNTLVGSLSGLAGGVVTPQVWNYQQTAPQTTQGGAEAAQEAQNAPVTGNETPAPAEGARRPQNTPVSFENTVAADILMGAAPQKQRAGFTSLENAMANQFERETGISIESVESILGGLANGDYNSANWVARIAQDAKDPKMVVVAHELTHHLQTLAPQEYESFRTAVADYFTRAGGEGALTDMMNRYRSAYGAAGQNLSDSAVMDEMAADFTEVLLTDADLFGQFARENRTLAERLLDALRAFIEKIRATFTGRARDAAAQEATGKTLNELEMIAEQWQSVYRAAAAAYGQNANTATQEGDGVVRYKRAGTADKNVEKANAVPTTVGGITEDAYSSGEVAPTINTALDIRLPNLSDGVNTKYSLNSVGAEMDSDYIDAVHRGDMETAQRMVNKAAKEAGVIMNDNGRKPLSLYRGTPNFGRTVFKSPVIFASTSPSVSGGYGGNKGYARQRLISESYTPDDGRMETLIKNAKNVLGWNLKPYDDAYQNEIRDNTRALSDEISRKVNDVWTGEAMDALPNMTEELDTSVSWVLSLPGSINENIDDFGGYMPISELENWIDKFDEHLPKLREYFNQHRSELRDTAAWPMFKLVMGYDLSDFAIDARYKLLQSFEDDLLLTENGNLVRAETVRDQVESLKDIGSYHLYGFAGDNPLVIDGNGAMWHGVPVEQWGGHFTTDEIVKRAQEEGYTSVCIKNINDVAMNNYSANVKSDIYAFFDREQVKSADPVTYDDNGKVIPLSQRFDETNHDIRYSINVDSDGRQLSEGQKAYFANSKSVDAQGRLRVMYRGGNSNFTVFDRKKSSYANLYGRGFYFTDSKSHAEQYGGAREFYLDITNPVPTDEQTITREQLLNFLQVVAENEDDYSFENYGYGATPESMVDAIYSGKSDFAMLYDVSQTAIGDMVEAVELFNEINGTDFDGLILDTETVIFNSEQAKLTDNKTPTDNPDIRFSLKKGLDDYLSDLEAVNTEIAEHQKRGIFAAEREGGNEGVLAYLKKKDALAAKKRRIERIIRDLSQPVVESAEQIDSKAFKLWFGDWPNGKGSKVVDADGKPLVVYHGTGTTIEEFLPEFTGKGNDQYGSGFYFTTNESTATGYTTRTLNGQEKPGGSDNPNVIPVYLNIRHPLIVDAAKTSNLYDVDVSPVMASRIISRMPDIMDPEESILGEFFEEYWEIGPKNYMISRLAREYEWTLGSLANDIFRDYPTEFRQVVKEVLGYDGVQVNFSNGEKHFVAWFPNQIKHATENSGAFSKKDNRIKASLKSTAPMRQMMAEMPQQMMIRMPRLTTVAQDEAEAAGLEAAPVEDTVQLPQLGLTDADVPGTEPLTRQDIAREMAWKARMANEPAAPQAMGEVRLPDLSADMEEAGMGVADFTGNVETVPQEATAEILSALEDLSRDMEAPMETPTDATVRDAENLISAETVEAPQSLKEKAAESWAFFKRKMVDSGEAVTQIGKAINDKYLYPFYNMARASASAGANMIAEEQTDVNGRTVGESLNAIFDPIRAKGKDYYVNFQTYMYDLHNIARMSMDKNAQKERDAAEAAKAEFLAEHPKFINMTREQARRKADSIDELEAEEAREYLRLERWQNRAASMGNKPVFDYEFSAEMSRGRSERLLREHPEFAQYREQVRKYIDNLMKYRVDSGLMTQKNADFLREYYPDYVPTDRHQAFEDFGPEIKEKRVRIAKTVKRAKGGNEKLVPLHEALGKQTMQVVREGSKNRFGARLLQDYTANASDAGIAKYIRDAKETEADFDINSFDEEKKTKENTFSVYFDGKLYEMEVNDALLEAVQALSPSDNLMKYWPVELSHNLNKLYKAMITGYNPAFAIRNTVRDLQTAGLYSRNFAAWAKNYPKALQEIAKDGEMWKQYKALGGDFSSVYDYATGTVRKPNTMVGKVADKMQALNMAMEQAPRLAEFMAVMEKGDGSMESAMDAMLAAADVTTNFGRSGTWGKVLNAHIVPFLNPGIQGFDKMVRYATQSRSGKQWLMMAARAAALGIAPSLINALLYHDDEEWEELRDSDKDTNYMFKLKDGLWLKIPKGRELSVLGIAADRVGDAIRGEDVNIRATLNTIGTQVAPANPLNENIAKAWLDADLFNPSSPGRTWYGGDIEGQRLQNYAPGERYDSSTDVVSKAIGGALNLSPKKLNYLADQYTGVVGDIVLPLLTPQAERDMFSKAFTVDSISSNELSSKFYEKADELTYAKYGGDAVAAVVSRYWNSISSDVSKLYEKIRNVENSDLSNREKKAQVQELQRQINAIQREALATVDQYTAAVENSLFGDDDDAADFAYRETNREVLGAKSALETYNKDVYAKAQEAAKNGVSYEAYYDYYFATKDIEGDKDTSGKTIPGSKREKVLAEINAMDLTVEQKNALYYASGYAESRLYEAPWYTIQMPRL